MDVSLALSWDKLGNDGALVQPHRTAAAQQRQVDQVPAYLNLPLGELETFMESFRSDKAWKTRKDFLALKTRELFRVPFHEQ